MFAFNALSLEILRIKSDEREHFCSLMEISLKKNQKMRVIFIPACHLSGFDFHQSGWSN